MLKLIAAAGKYLALRRETQNESVTEVVAKLLTLNQWLRLARGAVIDCIEQRLSRY